MPDCKKCIFPLLRGCPVILSLNNAACLRLYKDRDTCKAEDCSKCEYLKYCKEKGINLNDNN
jgi:hypothetical protein